MDGEMEDKETKIPDAKELEKEDFPEPYGEPVFIRIAGKIITIAILVIILFLPPFAPQIEKALRWWDSIQPKEEFVESWHMDGFQPVYGQKYVGGLESYKSSSIASISANENYHPIYSSGEKILIYKDQDLSKIEKEIELPGKLIEHKIIIQASYSGDSLVDYLFLTQNEGKNYITILQNKEPFENRFDKFPQSTITFLTEGTKFANFELNEGNFACVTNDDKTIICYDINGKVVFKKTFAIKSAFFLIERRLVQYDGSKLIVHYITTKGIKENNMIKLPHKGDISKASLNSRGCFLDGSHAYYLDHYISNYFGMAPFEDVKCSFLSGDYLICKDGFVLNVPEQQKHDQESVYKSRIILKDKYNSGFEYIHYYESYILLIKNTPFGFRPFLISNVEKNNKPYHLIALMEGLAFGKPKGCVLKDYNNTFEPLSRVAYFYTDHGVYRFKEMAED